ncbi:MAG: serine/threonine-protein kinase [Proteobacteria bacterium]|nr:serine/threonine-protein kinase [Pseudomonadota bacterium]
MSFFSDIKKLFKKEQPAHAAGKDEAAIPAKAPNKGGTVLRKPDEVEPIVENRSDEDAEASPWKVDRIILNEYIIERELGQGGMGTVYLVAKRASDGTRFAVKTLLSSVLKDEIYKNLFMKELRTWIELPEHPHITACRFFRTVDDRLAIFAEYIDGGTLRDWIRGKKLNSLEKILDAAIQTAWGLEAAHTQGVIHQDMKPANVLMTKDGTAKITDFGLARAKNTLGVDRLTGDIPKSAGVSTLGMTKEYCSPEQAAWQELAHKTDIWSWGLSVFEMFKGSATWGPGTIAMHALEEYIKSKPAPDLPRLPESVAAVLRRCFEDELSKRWDNLGEAAKELIEIYRKETGKEYHRKKPEIKSRQGLEDITHDRRTIRGTKWEDPRVHLAEALKLSGRDQSELEALLKEQKGSRKAQALLDLEVYERVLSLHSNLIEQGRKEFQTTLASLLVHKAFVHEDVADVPGAIAMYDKAIQIYERLVNEEGKTEPSNALADVYINKANAVMQLGDNRFAAEISDKAIQIYERLVDEEGKTEFSNNLARVYMNKAIAVSALGDNRFAAEISDKAIQIYERLVDEEGKTEFSNGLATVYMNNAVAVSALGDKLSAVELYEKAIQIYERLVNKEGKTEFSNGLATVYMNKAVAVMQLGDNRFAAEIYEKAIQIRERLVNKEGRTELTGDLAWVKIYKATVLDILGETQKAREEFQQALPALRKEVQSTRRADLANVLKWAETNLQHLM